MQADERRQRSDGEGCLKYRVGITFTRQTNTAMKSLYNCALVLFFTMNAQVGRAQAFIPDQLERDWLNATIPGIVDGSGIMDTLHPGIASLDTASMVLYPNIQDGQLTLIELNSLRYMHSLVNLDIALNGGFYPTLICTGLPNSLASCGFSLINGCTLVLPSLPDTMESFNIRSDMYGNEHTSVSIAEVPNYTQSIDLEGVGIMDWEGTWNVGMFVWEHFFPGGGEVVFPAIHANNMEIWGSGILLSELLDLSNTTTNELFLFSLQPGQMALPALCTSIISFNGGTNSLTGGFPSNLTSLYLSSGIWHCLPPLPNSVSNLHLQTTIQCLPNWPSSLSSAYVDGELVYESTATYCSVLNSTCPGAYPGISGRVFADTNGNGSFDLGEPGLPQASVTLQPNGNVVGCQVDGTWEVGVAPGAYTITAGSSYPYIQSITPAEHTADVPELGDTDMDNDFAVTLIPNIQDLRVSLYADPARPGFDNQVYLGCENYGTTMVDASLTLAFDADQTWLSSSVAPSSTAGNTATWNFQAIPIGAVQNIVVGLNTAASVPLGTAITHMLNADPVATDETPLDNTTTFNDSVVGSYDPNDKLLAPAVLTPDEVALGETPIEYTIRFQNTGTYHAERVVILDTLSADLQWESMRFIASSHDQHWYIVDGVLHVLYDNIMLPDSNANEPESHGFFQFSMLPKTDLVNGSTIENIAHIIFDFNAPIITPPAVFLVDITSGVEPAERDAELSILPNPAHDRIQIRTEGTTAMPYRILDMLGQQVMQGTVLPNI